MINLWQTALVMQASLVANRTLMKLSSVVPRKALMKLVMRFIRSSSIWKSILTLLLSPVRQKQVGSLIGQGGAALDELRQATGARIDVSCRQGY